MTVWSTLRKNLEQGIEASKTSESFSRSFLTVTCIVSSLKCFFPEAALGLQELLRRVISLKTPARDLPDLPFYIIVQKRCCALGITFFFLLLLLLRVSAARKENLPMV